MTDPYPGAGAPRVVTSGNDVPPRQALAVLRGGVGPVISRRPAAAR
ncbi:hypothetical protein ABZV78_28600 [Micromonospora sp. NPDC004540]